MRVGVYALPGTILWDGGDHRENLSLYFTWKDWRVKEFVDLSESQANRQQVHLDHHVIEFQIGHPCETVVRDRPSVARAALDQRRDIGHPHPDWRRLNPPRDLIRL